jgi:hypothetical protein
LCSLLLFADSAEIRQWREDLGIQQTPEMTETWDMITFFFFWCSADFKRLYFCWKGQGMFLGEGRQRHGEIKGQREMT